MKLTSLGLTLFLVSVAACSAPPDSQTPDDSNDLGASADELNASAKALVGAYKADGSSSSKTFIGLVLKSDGTFFADVDNGEQCEDPSCHDTIRFEGRYRATKKYLTFTSMDGKAGSSSQHYGRVSYVANGGKLTLTHTIDAPGWDADLVKADSYCASVADCAAAAKPASNCVAAWTCGTVTPNTCSFDCEE